jgi:integrase
MFSGALIPILTWLPRMPRIVTLTSFEQSLLFQELPPHLEKMALFKVNTGTREQEVCSLKWEWEIPVPELKTSVFIVPKQHVKNGEERLIVMNKVAFSVIEGQRGHHTEYVFTYKGKRMDRMNNSAWKRARIRAAKKYEEKTEKSAPEGFRRVRVHDLKHTFGRRLRSGGVSFEDRQDLLGHKSGRITTHYSAAELENLIAAASVVCNEKSRKTPALVLLRSNC